MFIDTSSQSSYKRENRHCRGGLSNLKHTVNMSEAEQDTNNHPKGVNHHRFRNLEGRVFGRCKVEAFYDWHIHPNGTRRAKWNCVCSCGKTFITASNNLLSGDTVSCGCARIGARGDGSRKHPLYETWAGMIQRCENPSHQDFHYYGGRGIIVCEKWRMSFTEFLKDIGIKPSNGHSLDRFPNKDGNYEPGNVRWATAREQCLNKRNNRFIEHNGVRLTLSEWSEKTGQPIGRLFKRIAMGWTIERALYKK